MGKIFKLMPGRARVEIDEDVFPPRMLRLLRLGHRQVHEADLSTGSEESEDDVDHGEDLQVDPKVRLLRMIPDARKQIGLRWRPQAMDRRRPQAPL